MRPSCRRLAIARAATSLIGSAAVLAQAEAARSEPPASSVASDAWDTTYPAKWIELHLTLVRRDVPWPTVQARTLFHICAAMFDACAGFEDDLVPVLSDLHAPASIPRNDRMKRIAMGSAAMEIARRRVARTNRDGLAFTKLDGYLRSAGLLAPLHGSDAEAAAFGRAVARRIAELALDDGANEAAEYDDPSGYTPRNRPLDPWSESIEMADPNCWQPLIVDGRTQEFVTPHWGGVRPFAISRSPIGGPFLDPGPPIPLSNESHEALAAAMVELLYLSSLLDGDAADAEAVRIADTGRVTAEFWEDGPNSETPPGHWNTITLRSLDSEADTRGGRRPLAQEAELLLAVNAALHDAAIACWDLKRHYDSSRPISLIRYMAELGQSSDNGQAQYHPLGLPLVPGLIELVTAKSSRPGASHEHLAGHRDRIAVRTWRGPPEHPNTEVSGVGWILASRWLPYQDAEFITPAFSGYPSGHSTFSAAAAEVLRRYFGSDQIPGGPIVVEAEAGAFLEFEAGPTQDTSLTLASFTDGVDQAGRSRLWGGIHPWYDDAAGRTVGRGVAHAVLQRLMSPE